MFIYTKNDDDDTSHKSDNDALNPFRIPSCLCLSRVGCALPGSAPCCSGLVCSGDVHHSECVAIDASTNYISNKKKDENSRNMRHSSKHYSNYNSVFL